MELVVVVVVVVEEEEPGEEVDMMIRIKVVYKAKKKEGMYSFVSNQTCLHTKHN